MIAPFPNLADTPRMRISTIRAPMKPAIGMLMLFPRKGSDADAMMTIATAREAPELTPRMYGPARLFLKSC